MDIAIVTTRLVDKDAQGNFTAATAIALKEKCKGKVSIFTFAYERPPIDGVDVHFMAGANGHNLLADVKAALRTKSLARELSKYDLLLLVGPDIGAIPAAHRAKKYNPSLRLVWVYHGLTPVEFLSGWKEKALTRIRMAAYLRSMRRSDLVQTFSEYIKKEIVGEGVDPSRIIAMPFGVDIARFSSGDRAGARLKYGIGDAFLLLYVGRLAGLKHVDELIEAMKQLKGNNVKLLIVGGGPESERLKILTKKLGLERDVIFAGRVDDEQLPDCYAACDAWITASRHEGFCVPIVEAMAAGKPVIVPDLAAMPETAGDAGFTYNAGDVEGLIRIIMALVSDRGLYDARSGRAMERAKLFEIVDVLEKYSVFIINAVRGL